MRNYYEENLQQFIRYFENGCNNKGRLGVEVEHFVLDASGQSVPYAILAPLIQGEQRKEEKSFLNNGVFLGFYDESRYSVSFEPGMQLEVSIRPESKLDKIAALYEDFYKRFSSMFQKHGYHMVTQGYHPHQCADRISMIPKKRYDYMDRYFALHGTTGKQMMRATASTQVSIDYRDEADCVKKLRLIIILSPILAVMTQNSPWYEAEPAHQYSSRTFVWDHVDQERCGLLKECFDDDFSFLRYADKIMNTPAILSIEGENSIYTGETTIAELCKDRLLTIEEIEHYLSMFFFDVRLKHYLEIRIADSLPQEMMLAYVALIDGLMNRLEITELLWQRFGQITYEQVMDARKEMQRKGAAATYCGRSIQELALELLTIAGKENVNRQALMPMRRMMEKDWTRDAQLRKEEIWKQYYSYAGETAEDIASAKEELRYLEKCSSIYHGIPTDTCYLAKLFLSDDVEYFRNLIRQLYGIFDKVMHRYETDAEYRKLFGFDTRLEELILRPRTYSSNIPVARIDIFYHEDSNTFEFCEFNTDGSSAMNEDRELCIAVERTLPYQKMSKEYQLKSFELFDPFIDRFLAIFHEFAGTEVTPVVAIVDFMEQATLNEFKQFKKCFEEREIPTIICDIRELKKKRDGLYGPDGTRITAIYRRAVTSDIMNHFDEVTDFLEAVSENQICLIGDFRTQIVHNKVIFEVLHHQNTMEMLTESERSFIIEHVPMTYRMEEFLAMGHSLTENKDQWIIKPQDSYGARGVYPGTLYTQEEWAEILSEADQKEYLVQRFYTPWCQTSYKLLHDGMEKTPFYHLTGLFVYDGEFAGVYSRVSRRKIISTQYSEIALPTLIVSPKA